MASTGTKQLSANEKALRRLEKQASVGVYEPKTEFERLRYEQMVETNELVCIKPGYYATPGRLGILTKQAVVSLQGDLPVFPRALEGELINLAIKLMEENPLMEPPAEWQALYIKGFLTNAEAKLKLAGREAEFSKYCWEEFSQLQREERLVNPALGYEDGVKNAAFWLTV